MGTTNFFFRWVLPSTLLVVGVARGATTFDALKSEIAAVEEGGTVYVENDMEYTSGLGTIAKTVTIRSPEGQTNVLTRASGYVNGALLSLTDAAANVTFADVVIDGNKAAGQQSGRFMYVSAGSVTFDAGCELRNVQQSADGAILVETAGTVVMNDGAVLRGFSNAQWGTCVEIKGGGRFEMTGGLITENESLSGNFHAGYGGAVYVYGGRFYMSGGLITGNTATQATAGVANYSGRFYLLGNASITNNHGGIAHDVASWGAKGTGGYIMFDIRHPWTGWATVTRTRLPGDEDSGWIAYVERCEEFIPGTSVFPGLGHLSIQDHPEYVANGYGKETYDEPETDADGHAVTNRYGSIKLSLRKFKVDSLPCVAWTEVLDAVRDNSEVTVCTNVAMPLGWAWPFEGITGVTLRSGVDGPYMIRRQGGYVKNNEGENVWVAKELLVITNASLRVENLILDGGGWGPDLLVVRAGGILTLGAGTVVQNVSARGCNVQGAGANLVMEPGAMIRDCRALGAKSYGPAVLVGFGGNPSPRPKFTMTGGIITNCTVEGPASSSYGGTVYSWSGDIEMTGGSIVGNTNTNKGPSGLYCYSGTVRIGGTARVVDNVGPLPDIYGAVTICGDYRGRAGVSGGNQGVGQTSNVKLEAGATGAWCLHPAAESADATLTGLASGTSIVWANAIARIDGVGFASAEDLALGRLTTIDVDADALPHVYAGSALALGDTVAVTFDSDARFAAGTYPVTLMTAEEGTFSGNWRFTLPVAPKGMWTVSRMGTAFVLNWLPKGTLLLFR